MNSFSKSSTPQRTKIQLKNRRSKKIPEIHIKLDDMLTETYSDIQAQDKIHGSTIIFKTLDNKLLREYIEAVYEEYDIPDPLEGLVKSIQPNSKSDSQRSKSSSIYNKSGQISETTPKKSPHFSSHPPEKQSTDKKNKSKTIERLVEMKKKFQSELQSGSSLMKNSSEQQIYGTYEYLESNPSIEYNQHEERKFPIKKTKRVRIRLSNQRENSDPKRPQSVAGNETHQSYLLTKSKFKYCLMCEMPLEGNNINSHERQCKDLQNLLREPYLNLKIIAKILDDRIMKLKKEINMESSQLEEDLLRTQLKIKMVLMQKDLNEEEDEDEYSKNSTTEFLSKLSVIKCMEKIDRLTWFRKMRSRAEFQKEPYIDNLFR